MKQTGPRMVLFTIVILLSVLAVALWLVQRQSANRISAPLDQAQQLPAEGERAQKVEPSASPSSPNTTTATPITNASTQETIPPSDEIGDVRPLTTLQVFNLSTRVVLAKCRSVAARKVTGGNIFTFLEFETINVIKGPKDTVVALRLLGGRIGDTEISSANIPSFKTGEEVVLFLGRENKDGYPTVFPQGVFRVRTNPTSNTKIVLPRPSGIRLFNPHDDKPYSTPPDPLPLEDFLFSLRKLK